MSEISSDKTVTEDNLPVENADNQSESAISEDSSTDIEVADSPQSAEAVDQSEAEAEADNGQPTGDDTDTDTDSESKEDEPIELSAEQLADIEAVLFTTDSPISPGKIAEVVQLEQGRPAAKAAIEALNERYEQIGSAFRIEQRAGGYRMLTLPEHNEVLARMLKVRSENRLTPTALETLAIIAYKQPILRVDIEAIRGVSSGEMTRSLMEKGLVKIVGRAEEIGRPMLYGTTSKFLELFGLNSLKDLPEVEALTAIPRRKKTEDAPAVPETPQPESTDAQDEVPSDENAPVADVDAVDTANDATDTGEDIESIEAAANDVAQNYNVANSDAQAENATDTGDIDTDIEAEDNTEEETEDQAEKSE